MKCSFKQILKDMSLFSCCLMAILLSSCDAHKDLSDTTMKPCHILCTDGSVISYNDYVSQQKTAIGVVFYVNQSGSTEHEGTGYAVYLWDVEPEAFADSLGTKQNTSADISKYDGNTNTYAIYNTNDIGSPLANKVFNIWYYGQSAYIPSVSQMRLLYQMKSTINEYIRKCGGDSILDNPDECWYWTSTEVAGQEADKAWLFSLSSGAIQETPKDQPHKVRPIINIY